MVYYYYHQCSFFLSTGKLNQILAPPAILGLRHDYKAVTSKLSKKTKCDVKDNNVYGFITINISTPFFNWKIAAILFVSKKFFSL